MAASLLLGTVIFSLFLVTGQNCVVFSDSVINKSVANDGYNSLGRLAEYKKLIVTVNGYNITAFVADKDIKRVEGLSGIEKITQDEGMLFVLDFPSKQGFWMKDMKFPLDIIWLDDNKTVVYVEKNLQPCTSAFFCPVFTPSKNAKFVLETTAGFADAHSLNESSTILFNLK